MSQKDYIIKNNICKYLVKKIIYHITAKILGCMDIKKYFLEIMTPSLQYDLERILRLRSHSGLKIYL